MSYLHQSFSYLSSLLSFLFLSLSYITLPPLFVFFYISLPFSFLISLSVVPRTQHHEGALPVLSPSLSLSSLSLPILSLLTYFLSLTYLSSFPLFLCLSSHPLSLSLFLFTSLSLSHFSLFLISLSLYLSLSLSLSLSLYFSVRPDSKLSEEITTTLAYCRTSKDLSLA